MTNHSHTFRVESSLVLELPRAKEELRSWPQSPILHVSSSWKSSALRAQPRLGQAHHLIVPTEPCGPGHDSPRPSPGLETEQTVSGESRCPHFLRWSSFSLWASALPTFKAPHTQKAQSSVQPVAPRTPGLWEWPPFTLCLWGLVNREVLVSGAQDNPWERGLPRLVLPVSSQLPWAVPGRA